MLKITPIIDLIKMGSTTEALEEIIQLRDQTIAIQDENIALKTKNRKLDELLKIRSKLMWEKPYYWLVENDVKNGPYCQLCYDKEKQLIRLQEMTNAQGMWECFHCKSVYKDSSWAPNSPHPRAHSHSWMGT